MADSAAQLANAPKFGNCTDCLGELNGALNACPLDSPSCQSCQNDDEEHFVPPWAYNSSKADAVQRLIAISTGGDYDPGLLEQPFSLKPREAASFIVRSVGKVVTGQRPPPRPLRQKQVAAQLFDGKVMDSHTANDGSKYIRVLFGSTTEDDPVALIDAEFSFPADDNIINLRASSRTQPDRRTNGSLSLSLSKGVVYDQNAARRLLERLRKALNFETVPVITGFDPKYNSEEPLFFERLYQPFLRGQNK
eukprot:jgi/Astpho2/3164/Aster-x0566